MVDEAKVQKLKAEFEAAVAECKAEPCYAEVGEDDIAFDLSTAMALQEEDKEVAREFLMREWGYLPQDFLRHAG